MPHPFFDAVMYPLVRADAQRFHQGLSHAFPNHAAINAIYRRCGATLPALTQGVPPLREWEEALDVLTRARLLKKLCDLLLADPLQKALHADAQALVDAPDPVLDPVVAETIVFVDRKDLRAKLQKLHGGAYSVLLVRGVPQSGKSWTRHLVHHLADTFGAKCIYLFQGGVATVEEVVESIFTALDDVANVPPKDETEDAWYRKVCIRMEGSAQKKKMVCWLVVDDLGHDENNAPRLDPKIRKFFEQIGLNMLSPTFSKWFRLVLLDYPNPQVPTKWKAFWTEERIDENEIGVDPLSDFLLAWAARNNKQMGKDQTKDLAQKIMAKVALEPAAGDDRSRLQRIYDELMAVLDTL